MKTTKGPWNWEKQNTKTCQLAYLTDKSGQCILEVTPETYQDNDADLALIATAPDLLSALQGLMSVVAQFRASHGLLPAQKELMNEAFKAINKAKGGE